MSQREKTVKNDGDASAAIYDQNLDREILNYFYQFLLEKILTFEMLRLFLFFVGHGLEKSCF